MRLTRVRIWLQAVWTIASSAELTPVMFIAEVALALPAARGTQAQLLLKSGARALVLNDASSLQPAADRAGPRRSRPGTP